jgi:hypothetical protein
MKDWRNMTEDGSLLRGKGIIIKIKGVLRK